MAKKKTEGETSDTKTEVVETKTEETKTEVVDPIVPPVVQAALAEAAQEGAQEVKEAEVDPSGIVEKDENAPEPQQALVGGSRDPLVPFAAGPIAIVTPEEVVTPPAPAPASVAPDLSKLAPDVAAALTDDVFGDPAVKVSAYRVAQDGYVSVNGAPTLIRKGSIVRATTHDLEAFRRAEKRKKIVLIPIADDAEV